MQYRDLSSVITAVGWMRLPRSLAAPRAGLDRPVDRDQSGALPAARHAPIQLDGLAGHRRANTVDRRRTELLASAQRCRRTGRTGCIGADRADPRTCAKPPATSIPEPTYNEHAAAFAAQGWTVSATIRVTTRRCSCTPTIPTGRIWTEPIFGPI